MNLSGITHDIFEAVKHGMRMYMHGRRHTGRTTALLAAVSDGDVIVVHDHRHGSRIVGDARRMGKNISAISVPTNRHLSEVYDRIRHEVKRGSVHFEHTWVECYISDRIDGMHEDFVRLCEMLEEARRLAITPIHHTIEYSEDGKPKWTL